MNTERIYALIKKHADVLRGLSGLAAITVLLWGVVWPWASAKYFTPDILIVHDYRISDGRVGGTVLVNAVITKSRGDCDATVYFEFVDIDGIVHTLTAPQTRTPPLSRVAWKARVPVPAEVTPGEYQFNASVKYSHVSDLTCNKVYFLPGAVVTIRGAVDDGQTGTQQ